MTDALAQVARDSLMTEPKGVYLNTAAEGLLLKTVGQAWRRYSDAKASGSRGRPEFDAIQNDARDSFARAIRARPKNVGFIASTSRGLDIVIKGIDWRPGDVLVTAEGEFPTTLFSLELLSKKGVTIKVVPADGGYLDESRIAEVIDSRTRLIVLSMVSFKTGQWLNFSMIGTRAQEVSALLYVDAVQAVGAGVVDVAGIDVLAAATFKWQLGVHGAAGLYVSDRARDMIQPSYAGYRGVQDLFPSQPSEYQLHADTRRFEEGMPGFLALAALATSLGELEAWGYENIDRHNRRATRMLRQGLLELGIDPLLSNRDIRTGGIVAFETAKYQEISEQLSRWGTEVWARDGRVRMSAHAYTTDSDVFTVLNQLQKLRSAI